MTVNLKLDSKNKDSVVINTVRLIVNFLTNVLIVLTVFVCLLYSCTSWSLNFYQLHILLCVLGYQFFMCQGTLVLSKYNSWSMYLTRQHRRHLHTALQVIGVVLVTVGSSLMISEKHVNFDTAHGITGLCALIMSLLGLINGLLAAYAHKWSAYISVRCVKFLHYVTGVGTLLLSAVCLCLGFDKISFRSWAGNSDTALMMASTCIFTVLVATDFWLAMGNRIRSL